MDIKSAEERSRNMSAIRSKDTKQEVYLRKLLFARGFRYRKNPKNIFGQPDIYLSKYKTAIFVHGCFWHRHSGCKYAYTPKSRVDFWTKKFQNNIQRDKVVQTRLLSQGYHVIIIWECTINNLMKNAEYRESTIRQMVNTICEPQESGTIFF